MDDLLKLISSLVIFELPDGRIATVRSVQGLSILMISVYFSEAVVGSLPSNV